MGVLSPETLGILSRDVGLLMFNLSGNGSSLMPLLDGVGGDEGVEILDEFWR